MAHALGQGPPVGEKQQAGRAGAVASGMSSWSHAPGGTAETTVELGPEVMCEESTVLPSGVLPPTAAGEAAFQWRGHAGTVTVAVTGAMTGASAGDTADEHDRPVSKIPSQVMPITHACGSILVNRALVK